MNLFLTEFKIRIKTILGKGTVISYTMQFIATVRVSATLRSAGYQALYRKPSDDNLFIYKGHNTSNCGNWQATAKLTGTMFDSSGFLVAVIRCTKVCVRCAIYRLPVHSLVWKRKSA